MQRVFEPMSAQTKRDFLDRYLLYLKRTDGAPVRATRTLAERERVLRDLKARPVRWQGPPLVEPVEFARNNRRHEPEPGASRALLWALAVSRINRSEQYGVERGFKGEIEGDEAENFEVYIELEEFYHTRLLEAVLETLGLEMELLEPRLLTKWVIHAMVRLPKAASLVPVLISERGAAVSFWFLIQEARTLFAAQPEVLARIESILGRIMVDEVGHLHYVRGQLGPRALGIANRIIPAVGRRMLDDQPEVKRLFGVDRFMRKFMNASIDELAQDVPLGVQAVSELGVHNRAS